MADPQLAVLQFTAGSLPEDFCPTTWEEVKDAIVSRLIAQFNSETATFVNSSVIPTENMGPLFLNGTDIWVWDITLGAYRPLVLSSTTGQVPVGTCVYWAGTIANAPTNFNINGAEWQFCNGAAISRATYAEYFNSVGTVWGAGDGITTVNIPDTKDIMLACASVDNAGKPMTTIADPAGIALLQGRAYVNHWHIGTPQTAAGVGQGKVAGDSFTGREVDISSADPNVVEVRILPPFKAMTFMVRVK